MKRYFVKITETATEAHPYDAGRQIITIVGKGGHEVARSDSKDPLCIVRKTLTPLRIGQQSRVYGYDDKESAAMSPAANTKGNKWWTVEVEIVEVEL